MGKSKCVWDSGVRKTSWGAQAETGLEEGVSILSCISFQTRVLIGFGSANDVWVNCVERGSIKCVL